MSMRLLAACCPCALLLAACGSVSEPDQPAELGIAHAPLSSPSVDLIAIGTLSGAGADLSGDTAAPLENGIAGNLLGGIGSGIGYAGNGIFLAVPDRGPNAVSYNELVDDTTSYINRFQTLRLQLQHARHGAALPFELKPELLATTLLFSREPLVYGRGEALGLANGAPALNGRHQHFFVGRSDNFDAAQPSTDPSDARFDPESVRVSNDGQ
ncbi:MAG TPA: hypothetical protein VG963_31450, partial [Polyangiaceae bacterium]|nr:hypothetical protein [Polyangiaceae bacterium]